MKNFCSVTDINYLNKLLALNFSLKKYSNNYLFHVLCLDNETYEKINDTNIKKYHINNLLSNSEELKSCLNNPPSKETLIITNHDIELAKKKQFIFSLSAYFSWFCLSNNNVEDILYIDADIYFFDNWEKIYASSLKKSIGIVEHRCPTADYIGKFNVGIVYFKNDDQGFRSSRLWKNCMVRTNHQFYESHGTCGDQKYLELFSQFFSNIIIFDEFFGHLAPWNIYHHLYEDNKIIWNNKKQDLMYYHFSDFKIDYSKKCFTPAARHGIIKLQNKFLENLHQEYMNSLLETKC